MLSVLGIMDSGARSKFTSCLKTWWDTFIQQGSMQGRTQDLELGGAQRAEGRNRGWVREGAAPPPAPARGYGGAL